MRALRLPVLALLLALGSAASGGEPAARAPFAWPTPGLIEQFDVPGVVWSLGVPMKLRGVRLKGGLEETMQLYLNAFTAAGLYVPPLKHQLQLAREPTLVALDPRRLIAYTVIFQPNPDGSTSLMLGESNLAARRPPGGDGLPLFPGASGVMRTEQEGSRILTYTVKAKPEEVQSFYREVLGKAGYAEGEPDPQALLFSRKGEQLQLFSNLHQDGKVSVVVMDRAAPAEEAPSAPR